MTLQMLLLNHQFRSQKSFLNGRVLNYMAEDSDCIQSVVTSTDVVLEARDEVLASPGQEIPLAIAGDVHGEVARVTQFISMDACLESSEEGVERDTTGCASAYVRERLNGDSDIGEAHSHLPHHRFELSSTDRSEIARRRKRNAKQVFTLFKNEGDGKVSVRFYNAAGKAIPAHVRSHATGEVRTIDPSTPKSSFGAEFWGVSEAA